MSIAEEIIDESMEMLPEKHMESKQEERQDQTELCEWGYTEPECAWETDCGEMFSFEAGGTPKQHKYYYCPHCGRHLKTREMRK